MKKAFSLSELKPSEVRALLGEVHIERSRVTLGEVLMEGKLLILHRMYLC